MSIDDPKWRSSLTHSTYADIMHMRKLFRRRIAHVTAALTTIYRERQALIDAAIEGEGDD